MGKNLNIGGKQEFRFCRQRGIQIQEIDKNLNLRGGQEFIFKRWVKIHTCLRGEQEFRLKRWTRIKIQEID